jgi:hypothetical protein
VFIKVTVNGSTDYINTDHVKAIRWNGTGDGIYRVLFIDSDDVTVHLSDSEIERLLG